MTREEYWRDRDRHLAANKAYRISHAKEIRLQRQARYAANVTALRKRAKQWRDANVDRTKRYTMKHENGRRHSLGRMWTAYRKRSRVNGQVFSLPRTLFDDLVTDVCFYCAAAPAPTNGIDRVNNSRGYEEDNVVSCCKWCNTAKSVRSRTEFEIWAKNLAANITKWEAI